MRYDSWVVVWLMVSVSVVGGNKLFHGDLENRILPEWVVDQLIHLKQPDSLRRIDKFLVPQNGLLDNDHSRQVAQKSQQTKHSSQSKWTKYGFAFYWIHITQMSWIGRKKSEGKRTSKSNTKLRRNETTRTNCFHHRSTINWFYWECAARMRVRDFHFANDNSKIMTTAAVNGNVDKPTRQEMK